MEAAQSIRTRDNVAHSQVNHHQLLLGHWNILTLTGKELELVEEAKRYDLDIVGVSSTKQRGSGTVDLNGGWKLFYSGADPSMSAQADVEILTSPRLSDCASDWIPLGSRVCMLKLKALDRSLCLLQVYGPNTTSEYQAFVDDVNDALLRVSSNESTVLMGDFNAHIGTDTDTGKGVIEKHGVTELNENGRYLLQFCCSNGLRIMNSFFQHREVHKYTWYRPSMDQKYLIKFCIVSSDLFSDVLDVRVKRGADLSTDHHLVVCSLRLSKHCPNRKSNRSSVTYRIKWEALEDKEITIQFASVYHLSSDNFLMYPRTSRKNGCCSDQRSFHQLLKVVDENGLEWRARVRKEQLGGTKRLKKLFEQRKMRSRPGYRTDRHLIRNPGKLRREKRQLRQQRNPKISHEKSVVVVWIPTIFRQTKYFGRPSTVYVAKDRVSQTPSRILQVTF